MGGGAIFHDNRVEVEHAIHQPGDQARGAARRASRSRPTSSSLRSRSQSPGDGEIVVRNTFMSVDPYMRGRMNDGEVLRRAVPARRAALRRRRRRGRRVARRRLRRGRRRRCTSSAGASTPSCRPSARARSTRPRCPPSAYLGVLGMPGLTAYVGLLDIAALRDGDVVFVSGAAGAVGSLAGQIAKLRGHTVIGSAGSPEKVAHVLDDLGFDAAFDYHDGVRKQLRAAAPDGIDVYFDNVGGEHLEAAIAHAQHVRPRRDVRRDLDLQRDRAAARPAQPLPGRGQAADAARLHHHRPRATATATSCRRSAPGSPTAA